MHAAFARWGVALGSGLKMEDSLWSGLTDSHAGLPMGMTAENLAEKVTNLNTAKLICIAARVVRTMHTFLHPCRRVVAFHHMFKNGRSYDFISSA